MFFVLFKIKVDAETVKIKKGAILENIKIEDVAFGGEGIAKLKTEHGDFVLFVKNSLPGQIVTTKIIKKKKRFAKCKLVKVTTPSPDEVEHSFQTIPGAPFAKLPIEKQEYYKEHSTLEMFKRLSGVEKIRDLYDGYISSPSVWHYRNKMEYSFSTLISELGTGEETEGFALGFKRRGQWWAVENLEADSGLFDAQFEGAMLKIRQFCEGTGLPAWNPAKSAGFFRFLVVRKSYVHDELLFNLVTTGKDLDQFDKEAFVALLQEILGDRLAGVIHTTNDEVGDVMKQPGDAAKLLYGKEKIVEKILGLDFEISMQSFFQTNPKSAERLYSKVVEYASEDNELANSVIMDLFCGTGTIGQIIASKTEGIKIIGVDIVASAIENAKKNTERNGISGVEWFAADVGKFLFEFPEYEGKIDTIILDPPRAGIAPKTLKKIIGLGAQRIVYVSCNPATQARDIAELTENGFNIKKFSLVDQFPHTGHIESIAVFEKT